MIYRLTYSGFDESFAEYFGTRGEAERKAKELERDGYSPILDSFAMPETKYGWIGLLNEVSNHIG